MIWHLYTAPIVWNLPSMRYFFSVTYVPLVTGWGCNLAVISSVYFGHILHAAVTSLHYVPAENFMQSMTLVCWSIEKKLCSFVDIALLNGGSNQIIFRVLFFGFRRWFLVYLESTYSPLFFRKSSYSHLAALNNSSLDNFFNSLSCMELGI